MRRAVARAHDAHLVAVGLLVEVRRDRDTFGPPIAFSQRLGRRFGRRASA